MSVSQPHILIVDDNRITTKLLRRYMEATGFVTTEAFDGVECLEVLKTITPDAVIMDVMMPKLNGFETTKAIKSNPATASIPVILVTALNDVSTLEEAVEAGVDDFLTKPIDEKLLTTKVRLYVEVTQARQRINNLRSIVKAYKHGEPISDSIRELINAEGL